VISITMKSELAAAEMVESVGREPFPLPEAELGEA
jgi:hypothetical protein